jgi:putative DNA primase/helicase
MRCKRAAATHFGHMSDFISRHGDSRFSSVEERYDTRIGADAIVRDRAGWWEGDGERVYLFTSEGMREALKGFDFNRALDTLQEAGALPPANTRGERAASHRVADRGITQNR